MDVIEEAAETLTQVVGAIVDEALEESEGGVNVSADQLRSIVERVETLEAEKQEIAEQIKEVFAEAKSNGFDVATLRKIVALRKKKPEQRSEEEAMLDLYLYLSALGML